MRYIIIRNTNYLEFTLLIICQQVDLSQGTEKAVKVREVHNGRCSETQQGMKWRNEVTTVVVEALVKGWRKVVKAALVLLRYVTLRNLPRCIPVKLLKQTTNVDWLFSYKLFFINNFRPKIHLITIRIQVMKRMVIMVMNDQMTSGWPQPQLINPIAGGESIQSKIKMAT